MAGFHLPPQGSEARELLGDLKDFAVKMHPDNRSKVPCMCVAAMGAKAYLESEAAAVSVASVCYSEFHKSYVMITVDRQGREEVIWNFQHDK